MAITASGIGSGLDVQGIVAQLLQLEALPLQRLERQEADANQQISAYGRIQSAVSSFQDAMKDLSEVDSFKIFTSTSSDEDVLTAETTSSAAAGIYNLQVDRLAQNHKQGSDEKNTTDTFGVSGDSITLTVGTDSTTVDLSAGLTLSEMRDAINSATDNPGVTATILNTGIDKQRLVLTANDSGSDSRVDVTYGGIVDANTFNFTTTNQDENGAVLTDLADLDSSFTLDGFSLTSASNKVSGVTDGLTLDLKQVGSATLVVERDTDSIEESAQAFVDAYNNVFSVLDAQSSGALSGDSSLRSIKSQMRSVLNTAPVGLTGTFNSLSELGIKSDSKTGQLVLDASDFSDALDLDFSSVSEVFSDDDQGFAFRFEILAGNLLDTDGIIEARDDGLRDRIRSFQDAQADFERKLELKERSLRKQYASLDSLIGGLQGTANFLFQTLGL